jgi:hypothetical protein
VADVTKWSDQRLARELIRLRCAPGPALTEFERRVRGRGGRPVPGPVQELAKDALADLARLYVAACDRRLEKLKGAQDGQQA